MVAYHFVHKCGFNLIEIKLVSLSISSLNIPFCVGNSLKQFKFNQAVE